MNIQAAARGRGLLWPQNMDRAVQPPKSLDLDRLCASTRSRRLFHER